MTYSPSLAPAARIAEELQRGEPDRRACFAIARAVQAHADRRGIRTVPHNLLDNAWKLTSGRDDASIEFGTAPSGAAAVCSYVRDNGAVGAGATFYFTLGEKKSA